MTGPVTPAQTARFPDVIRLLAALLTAEGFVQPGRAGSQTPPDLLDQLPWIRIARVGGGSDLVNDVATVDIEVFDTTSRIGQMRAEEIRHVLTMTDLPVMVGHGLVDQAVCLTAPRELPWADTRIRRIAATYRITTRRYYQV